MNVDTVTTKQAIGRHGIIGSLYDIRNDQFEGGNLFNQQIPSSIVLITDCASSDYLMDDNKSQSETLNNLNIEGSMKLSLLSGVLKAEGSAKYLNQTKTDSRTVRVTFTYKAKTKYEHLQISMTDLLKCVSFDAFQNPHATHCVIGITYGACVAATFEQTASNSKEAEEVQGNLAAEFKKGYIDVEGSVKMNKEDKKDSVADSMKITLSGDILIDKIPITMKDVFDIFEKVPFMLSKLNDGKGKPIEFELYPLQRLAKVFNCELKIERMIKEVTSAVVSRIENIFEEITHAKRMFNDFVAKIDPWQEWLPPEWTRIVYEKKTELAGQQVHTQRELATLIQQIRRGEADEAKMVHLLDNFDRENPCSTRSIKEFLRENERIDAKIRSLGEFDQKASTEEERKPNTAVLLREFTSIQDFVLRYNDTDVFLLNISNKWEQDNKENWYKQLRYFCHLMHGTENGKMPITRVIDHDLHVNLHMKPDACVIFYAHDGAIKSRDYYCTAWETLDPMVIREIKLKHKFMFLNDKAVQLWHKTFIKRSPKGQLNEEDFISAYQQLYTSGSAGPYCRHIFHKIDDDNSGTISFGEFMSAISLSLLADIEQQLKFVFKLCTQKDSKHAHSDELINFIELITELEGGEDAVDPVAAEMIVHQIMESNKNTTTGSECAKNEINEEEFVDKCMKKYDLILAFLPLFCKKSLVDHAGLIKKRQVGITQDEILEQYRKILEELHRGILTKSSYTKTLKDYNPEGNSTSFCNYIFKGITKGRNNIINFDCFLDAHQLLDPIDVEHALTAAFNLCDIDRCGTIGSAQIETFVKIIAELNEKHTSTSSYNASTYALKHPKSIAKAIMGHSDNEKDNQIKSKNFVDCCKNDYWLCAAILPLNSVNVHHGVSRRNHSKPHINIATIGHKSHGKTTLTAAIFKVLHEKRQKENKPDEKVIPVIEDKSYKKLISVIQNETHSSQKQSHVIAVAYETIARRYVHFDCAGHRKFIKNMISTAAVLDGAILVVDATEGIMPQTREHLRIVRKFGVKNIVVFLNKTKDVDEKKLKQIEIELKELLVLDANNEDFIPIIRAWEHSSNREKPTEIDADAIDKLLHAIDVFIPSPYRHVDKNFLMTISDIHNISGKGIVAKGVVQRGTVHQGDQVEIAGYGAIINAIATKIQTFKQQIDRAKNGDYVGLLLRDLTTKQIRRRQVIAMRKTVTLHKHFTVDIYVLTKEEGGRHTPFFQTYQPQVFSKTGVATAKITFLDGQRRAMPGDNLKLKLDLFKGMVIEEKDPILLYEGGKLVATGGVIQILD
ncbi:unnamed protein product [Adineta ricciae]|uniref:Elongation factor Tu, mitochondrial n=1 Tax=Adineta ricciae TaxID=249248 RepID=A0A815NX71_ADIRI|nr:unnamed protein product [Adineta ricciae]CAF1439648.1 unnamed protein product [Adineta ricciae]